MPTILAIHGEFDSCFGELRCRNSGTDYFSPWVVLSDFGGAFSMGAVGGSIWHGIKGARNSPRVCSFGVYCTICEL